MATAERLSRSNSENFERRDAKARGRKGFARLEHLSGVKPSGANHVSIRDLKRAISLCVFAALRLCVEFQLN